MCSLVLDVGPIRATQNYISTHQTHHPKPTLAPMPLALALPLALTQNPKSTEELTCSARLYILLQRPVAYSRPVLNSLMTVKIG